MARAWRRTRSPMTAREAHRLSNVLRPMQREYDLVDALAISFTVGLALGLAAGLGGRLWSGW